MGTPLSEARADKKKIKTHKKIWLKKDGESPSFLCIGLSGKVV